MGIGPLNTTPGTGGAGSASDKPPAAAAASDSISFEDGFVTEVTATKGQGTTVVVEGQHGATVGPVVLTPAAQQDLADEQQKEEEAKDDTADDDTNNDDDSNSDDDNSDDDGGDEPANDDEPADDGEPTEGEYVDVDAAGGIGSAGADFAGSTRADFVSVAGGSVVDIRFTNTGGPDSPATGPDTTGPVVVPATPGDETPQAEATDVLGFATSTSRGCPAHSSPTSAPISSSRAPTLDPSTLNPDLNPQAHVDTAAMALGSQAMAIDTGAMAFDLDAPMDAANIAIQASVGFATLDEGQGFDASSDFATVDTPDIGGSGVMGFDGDGPDGDDGMLGGPDGGPMP